jgi:glycosyltransferase involved in cell wall biosynthesis
MIEALAAGVPVVAPDIGVAREAGVIVLLREDLAGGVLETLEKRPLVGKLNMPLLNADEWAMQWKKTLI